MFEIAVRIAVGCFSLEGGSCADGFSLIGGYRLVMTVAWASVGERTGSPTPASALLLSCCTIGLLVGASGREGPGHRKRPKLLLSAHPCT